MNDYLSRPSAVEAIQWTGTNGQDVRNDCGDRVKWLADGTLMVKAGPDGKTGWVLVPHGDLGAPVGR